MKLNYVSVLREYQTKNRDCGYFVRGELNHPPTPLWFKYFKLLWRSLPEYRNLCAEPQLNRNEILIQISEGSSIPLAVEGLRSVVQKMSSQYIIPTELQHLDILDQDII